MMRLITCLLLIFPNLVLAQFDTTLGGTITEAHFECDAQVSASVKVTGGTQAGDGDNIATCENQGTGTVDATQTSSGAQPVLDSDGINLNPAIQGATGDWLQIADGAIARNLGGYTFATVLKYVDSAATEGIFQAPTEAGGNRIAIYKDGSDDIYFIQVAPDATDKSVYTNDAMTDGLIYRFIGVSDFTNNTFKFYLNGTEVHSATFSGGAGTSDTSAGEDAALMATNMYGGNVNKSLFGHFIWYKYALTAGQVGTLDTNLETYWAEPSAPSGGSSILMMGIGQ